jgi:hypothetical protein
MAGKEQTSSYGINVGRDNHIVGGCLETLLPPMQLTFFP